MDSSNYDIHLYRTRDMRWHTRVKWADMSGMERNWHSVASSPTASQALEVAALAFADVTRPTPGDYETALGAMYRAWATSGGTGGVHVTQIGSADLNSLVEAGYAVIGANDHVALTENGARFAFLFLYT